MTGEGAWARHGLSQLAQISESPHREIVPRHKMRLTDRSGNVEEWRVLGSRKNSTLMLQKSEPLKSVSLDGYPCDGQIYLSPNPSAAHVSGWLAAAGLLCPAQLLRRGDRIEVTGPDSGERPGTELRSSWRQ